MTQFADTAALASTWDAGLADAYGRAYGAEQAGKGHRVALAPTINILRLPTWGRAPETFSEDPYLTGAPGSRRDQGHPGQPRRRHRRALHGQHQEVQRSSINVVAGQETRKEIYEPAFKLPSRRAPEPSCAPTTASVAPTSARTPTSSPGALRDAWKFDGVDLERCPARPTTPTPPRSTSCPAPTSTPPPDVGRDLHPGRGRRHLRKVALRPGQTRTVSLALARGDLAAWSTVDKGWTVTPGSYRLYVGTSSTHLSLRTSIHVG